MGKKVVKRRVSAGDQDPISEKLLAANAKSLLLANVISMGWKLALTVLVPIYVGVQLDKRFGTQQTYTMTAFFVAVFAASVLIYKAYSDMATKDYKEDVLRFKKQPKEISRSKHE